MGTAKAGGAETMSEQTEERGTKPSVDGVACMRRARLGGHVEVRQRRTTKRAIRRSNTHTRAGARAVRQQQRTCTLLASSGEAARGPSLGLLAVVLLFGFRVFGRIGLLVVRFALLLLLVAALLGVQDLLDLFQRLALDKTRNLSAAQV